MTSYALKYISEVALNENIIIRVNVYKSLKTSLNDFI